MGATRRQVIKSLAGVVAGFSGIDRTIQDPVIPDTVKTSQKQQGSHLQQNMNRKAFVTLPGVSFSTIYTHLQTIMNRRPQPVILIDTYDFERLWGQIVMERGNRKPQMLGMITESLYRAGFLQTIDYGALYSAETQDRHINRYWEALENLPGEKQHRAAGQLADGFLTHCIGEYQKSFRSALCERNDMSDRRTQVEGQQRKMDRGGGDPLLWNERIAAQYIAALEVRAAADKHFDLDVVGASVLG